MKWLRLKLMMLAWLLMLCACQQGERPLMGQGHAHGHDYEMEQDYPHGVHGGRLLSDAELAVEMTIDEAGRPPRWQVYAFQAGSPIPPEQIAVSITLERLDGQIDDFQLYPEGMALVSRKVVTEPHSFVVQVAAEWRQRTYQWRYESFEGRVQIAPSIAQSMGIESEPVGSASLVQRLDVLGRVQFAPDAIAHLKAQFPGRVVQVTKRQGDQVEKGEILARIEANDSLRQYALKAPLNGVVIERQTNVGDVVHDDDLFVIGDLNRLQVNFHIYPGDFGQVQAGQTVHIESIDGQQQASITLKSFLPTTESATQTIVVYAELANPEQRWLPGMIVGGLIEIDREVVPLAVRTRALQRFRDFTVVFAQMGNTYEVRMLDLGRQNEEWTEVLGGIKPGQPYVSGNSYLIKADIEKAGASHDH